MSPEAAAIIGAFGGALLGVASTLYSVRRRERRDARGAARLLLAELAEARRSIAFALAENDWETLVSRPPQVPSWERVSQPLAASVRASTWRKVTDAARAVRMIAEVAACVDGPRRIYPDADPAAPGDSDRRELSEAQCEIENAILELGQTGKLRDEAEEVALDRELAERCP